MATLHRGEREREGESERGDTNPIQSALNNIAEELRYLSRRQNMVEHGFKVEDGSKLLSRVYREAKSLSLDSLELSELVFDLAAAFRSAISKYVGFDIDEDTEARSLFISGTFFL